MDVLGSICTQESVWVNVLVVAADGFGYDQDL
jgi:hypothetical protein